MKTMLKWHLIFKSLPYAIGILLIKLILIRFFHLEGILDIQEIRLILTAGVFLVGFMLAGTMADYKESEKIPGEIANKLEGIEETSITMAVKTKTDVTEVRQAIHQMGTSIHQWFIKEITDEEVYDALGEYNKIIQKIDGAGGAPPIVGRLLIQLYELRQLITRTQVISETGFLSTGYALLELLIVIVSILLLATNFTTPAAEMFITLFVELLYIYMYKLIRDIDDPFEYDKGGGKQKGSTEIPLFPLTRYLIRLDKRIASGKK